MASFIKDKLEIKFLILYVMSRIGEPLPLAGVQELTMVDEGIDYFAFSECLNDLVTTQHLQITEEDTYAITAKGIKNSQICESSLPYSVRLKADDAISALRAQLVLRRQVQGKIIPRENGTYTVDLSLNDDVDNLMHLQLMAATEPMARDIAKRFEQNPEELYSAILNAVSPKG